MKFEIHFEFRASLRKFQDLNFWDATPMQVIFRGTYWMRQWALLLKEDPRAQVKLGCRQLEMAMGTRNPNTRRVLPDMKAGTG